MCVPPHNRKKADIVTGLLDWFSRSARDLPWRRTADPYAIWVSEIMLQQTQVKTVIPFYDRWMRALPTILKLSRASSTQLHKLWEGLGYYTRVRNMQKAAKQILTLHHGEFPRLYEEILDLPGIGRYTAGAISSIAFNEPRPILDGNVMRVLARIFGIGGDPRSKHTNAQLWNLSESLVQLASRQTTSDLRACSHFNQALMELGALVCTPRQPRCGDCPVRGHCTALRTRRVEELPHKAAQPRSTARVFAAFVVASDGEFRVRQRPAEVVNGHLWEFPNVELNGTNKNARQLAQLTIGMVPEKIDPLAVIKHSITRYRITMNVFAVTLNGSRSEVAGGGHWKSLQELRKLPFAAAHKRVVDQLWRKRPSIS